MINISVIGENIKRIRIEKGLTQQQLADYCTALMNNGKKMNGSAIRKYESGKITPKIEIIRRIAEALKVSTNDITEWEQTDENGQTYVDYYLVLCDRAREVSDMYKLNMADAQAIVEGDFKLAETVFYKKVTPCQDQQKTPDQSESAQTDDGKQE